MALHKHTQYPGPGRTNQNVVGFPLLPVYAAKAGGFFFIVFGVLVLVGATVAINPIWNYGPYDPSPVSAGTQPDFYIGFIDGGLRLFPGFFEFTLLGFTVSLNVLLPALVIPGVFITAMVAYPFIEAWVTGDKSEHHLLDRPRNAPTRTGLGVMAIVAYCIMWAAAGNDLIATHFHLSINDLTWLFRIGVFVFPPLAFVVTRRICLSLQRKDRDLVLHGRETGMIVRTEEGEMYEVHEPLDEFDRWLLVQHESHRPIAAGLPGRRARRRGAQRPQPRRCGPSCRRSSSTSGSSRSPRPSSPRPTTTATATRRCTSPAPRTSTPSSRTTRSRATATRPSASSPQDTRRGRTAPAVLPLRRPAGRIAAPAPHLAAHLRSGRHRAAPGRPSAVRRPSRTWPPLRPDARPHLAAHLRPGPSRPHLALGAVHGADQTRWRRARTARASSIAARTVATRAKRSRSMSAVTGM